MGDTRVLLHRFEYREPTSVDEAVSLLAGRHGRSRVLAGGTDLIAQMKMGRAAPERVVSISRLPGMAEVAFNDSGASIGAMASIRQIGLHQTIRARHAALAEACAAFGSTQIEAMGTIGGNLCNASPAADCTPALIAFDAEAVIQGPGGRRRLPVEKLATGPGETALADGELLVAVGIPAVRPGTGSAFLKIARVAADIAKVNAAAVLTRDGGRVVDCRLVFGSVAPTVVRSRRAEAALIGHPFSPELVSEAARVAAEEVAPIDDVRSTAWYRRQIVRVLAHDCLLAAWDRAGQAPSGDSMPGHDATIDQASRRRIRQTEIQEGSANRAYRLELTVNGQPRLLAVTPNDLLFTVLRDELELTGAKYGCGIGECGACTVRIDGKPVLSCLVLAISANGSEVTTVEGLQKPDGGLDELQDAFIQHSAFQCGYCTPGILMAARSLLDEDTHPTEETVRRYLRGNLCRCTGYQSIVRAIMSAGDRDQSRVCV